MPTKQQVANAILGAKNILETDGWITGSMKCATGAHCAVGALRAQVIGSPNLIGAPHEALEKRLNPKGTYFKAIKALAYAVTSAKKRAEYFDLDEAEATTPAHVLVETYEDMVIDYNDGRVENYSGRRQVLNRFAKAAESVLA